MPPMAARGQPTVDAAGGVDGGNSPRGPAGSRPAPAGRRGRFAQELAATGSPEGAALAKQRARAERAEAALADLRRDSARAILGLRRQVTYWRLVAGGAEPADAARHAGLADPLEGHDPAGPVGG